MCPPGLVPIPHFRTSLHPLLFSFSAHPPPASVVLLAPKIMLQYFCSAWETLCIVGSSTRTANKRLTCEPQHTCTHTRATSLHLLPLHFFTSLSLPVISAGKSKHFKLSILRVTCGINSARAHECSKVNWRREVGAVGGQPPSDLALEMLFVKKMVSFGYNINPIASFVFDKYKNSYLAI